MATNIEVKAKQGESSDKLIKRFLKKMKKQDIIKEYLDRVSFFRSPSQKRRWKRAKNKFLKEKELKRYQ